MTHMAVTFEEAYREFVAIGSEIDYRVDFCVLEKLAGADLDSIEADALERFITLGRVSDVLVAFFHECSKRGWYGQKIVSVDTFDEPLAQMFDRLSEIVSARVGDTDHFRPESHAEARQYAREVYDEIMARVARAIETYSSLVAEP